MRRLLFALLLTGLLSSFVGRAPAQLPKEPEVQATVYYLDPMAKKEVSKDGFITEESIAGLKFKVGKDTIAIPSLDVRQITYKTKVNALEYRKAFSTETKARDTALKVEKRLEFYKDALGEFKALIPNVREIPQANRYINYKIAEVQASMADLDETKLDDAIKFLEAYRSDFGTGWETVPSMMKQADMLEKKGRLADAGKVYSDLADLPDAPEEVKQKAALDGTKLLLRAKKYGEAESRLQLQMTRLPKGDPEINKLNVMLCTAMLLQNKTTGVDRDLRTAIAGITDVDLLAAGHNGLGDFYRIQNQPEEAFWAYLRVHTLYSQSQDRTEHARALYHLWKLFDKPKNDLQRSQECLDRLLNGKEYNGTEWQTRAKAEAKSAPMP